VAHWDIMLMLHDSRPSEVFIPGEKESIKAYKMFVPSSGRDLDRRNDSQRSWVCIGVLACKSHTSTTLGSLEPMGCSDGMP
jgi:hypothetical protein